MYTKLSSYLQYWLTRFCCFPLQFVSYHFLERLGEKMGSLAYHLLTRFRKKTLSNLALAKGLSLTEKEIIDTAKKSFQNLAITCSEYPKLYWEKEIAKRAIAHNTQFVEEQLKKKQGVVLFCGHQANWEVLFLEATSRMPRTHPDKAIGTAIGRPINNGVLYDWVLSIREKFGGEIIPPRKAISEGLKALREGKFLGIVGDQARANGSLSFAFLGYSIQVSTTPALLSYKTGCPIVVLTNVRKQGKYVIEYADPLWPNLKAPIDQEIPRLTQEALNTLSKSILKHPEQWLWQHNCWKKEPAKRVYMRFRHDSILVILPQEKSLYQDILPHLETLRAIYPKAFLGILSPKTLEKELLKAPFSKLQAEIIPYSSLKECYKTDYRFKMVLNFTQEKRLCKHFRALSAFTTLSQKHLEGLARIRSYAPITTLSRTLLYALTRPKTREALLSSIPPSLLSPS